MLRSHLRLTLVPASFVVPLAQPMRLTKTRSGKPYACRRGLPRRGRHRANAEGAQFRSSRGACAGQAPPIDPPPCRRPRRSGAGARRLCAEREMPEITEALALLEQLTLAAEPVAGSRPAQS